VLCGDVEDGAAEKGEDAGVEERAERGEGGAGAEGDEGVVVLEEELDEDAGVDHKSDEGRVLGVGVGESAGEAGGEGVGGQGGEGEGALGEVMEVGVADEVDFGANAGDGEVDHGGLACGVGDEEGVEEGAVGCGGGV
jgi:hypothetical protein